MAAPLVPQLIAYNLSPKPPLPGSVDKWLQDEDQKIETSIYSLIAAIELLQSQVATLQSQVAALQGSS